MARGRPGLAAFAAALLAGCLSVPSPGDGSDDGGATDDDGGTSGGDATLLFFPFDAFEMDNSSFGARDRSGNGFDALYRRNAAAPAGRFGVALDPRVPNHLAVPDRPALSALGDYTIAAWIKLAAGTPPACGAIVGDHDGTRAERALELRDGVLVLATSAAGEPIEVAADRAVPTDTWVHVAATRTGDRVQLFEDGVVVADQTIAAQTEELGPRPWVAGQRGTSSTGCQLGGLIDEVRVVGRALSADELIAMSALDSTQPRCGDGVIDPTETCEPFDPCCDPASCLPRADGTPCLEVGSCRTGACAVEEADVQAVKPIVLFPLDEVGGTTAADSGELGLDLTLVSAADGDFALGGGCLTITAPTIARHDTAMALITALQTSGELTIEAWSAPADLASTGPDRIVTISEDGQVRNASLLQHRDRFVGRLRSTATSDNGLPPLVGPVGDAVVGRLQHLVMTRSADGEQRLYVDGRLRHRNVLPGTLATWSTAAILALADENDGATVSRAFLGQIAEAAIYDVALSPAQVAARFASGHPPCAEATASD